MGTDHDTLVMETPPHAAVGAGAPLVGRRLHDRFAVEGVLGSGGMGVVYRARDLVLERPVAVKVLRPEVGADPRFCARFFAEAKIIASLSANPHVVSVHDLGRTDDGAPFLVMELLEGDTLRTFLGTERRASRSWVLDVGTQIAAALVDAHDKGVVHRDLKPANIFVVDTHALPFLLKVIDFGIARSAQAPLPAEHATAAGDVLGTPRYMAPEIFAGAEPEPATDIYALGLILYEVACGRYPFKAASLLDYVRAHAGEDPEPLPGSLQPDASEFVRALGGLLRAALAKDPRNRPTAPEVLRELLRLEQAAALEKATARGGRG